MKYFLTLVCLIFFTVPVLAESFTIGGKSVSINLPPGYSKRTQGSDIVRFESSGHTIVFVVRRASDPLSDRSSWIRIMNGLTKEIFSAPNFFSEYTGSDSIDGNRVECFKSRGDFGTHSMMCSAVVFPVRGDAYLVAISAISTANRSYYDLDGLEREGKQMLRRISLR
jgi:hypothetical protein